MYCTVEQGLLSAWLGRNQIYSPATGWVIYFYSRACPILLKNQWMTCPAAVSKPSHLNTTFTSTLFLVYYWCCLDRTWCHLLQSFRGRITYSPSTQTALLGQLKVTFEGVRWDVKCRADWAVMCCFEPLSSVRQGKSQTNQRMALRWKQRCGRKVTTSLHFSKAIRDFFFYLHPCSSAGGHGKAQANHWISINVKRHICFCFNVF